jgi:hypothetical protein
MSQAPKFIEVISQESLDRGIRPPFTINNQGFPVISQMGPTFVELDRESTGVYKMPLGVGQPRVAVNSENAPLRGPVVMQFVANAIPVPNGPPLGAWFAAAAPNTTVESFCPWGSIGWLQGSNF